jgi:hypothetical protein
MKLLAAVPCVFAANDDSSTLLSLKVQTTLETGVDHLLDAVGSRNVTQMSSLLQNLVEETISADAPYQLDGDVTAALEVIKSELLGDIRNALKESHCYDQSDLHNQIYCFKGCEDRRQVGGESCGERCDGNAHKECRFDLLGLYKKHINACRALDSWVLEFTQEKCPIPQKKCCLLSHNTWNCNSLCAGTIGDASVDATFGAWLQNQISVFTTAYEAWTGLHTACSASHKDYVEKDAKCDCEQARCEAQNCAWDSCHHMNCEIAYQSCWAGCQAEWEDIRKEKECLEKDRKIDWSATEKIECYVNVLLEKPTPERLKEVCGTEDCYNLYREHMYKQCNEICVEVDFTNERGELVDHDRRIHSEVVSDGRNTKIKDQSSHTYADQDVTGEGTSSVKTMHRGDGDTKRCTSHLDIDYIDQPCCKPCDPRPSIPCEETVGAYTAAGANTYMWLHYHQHGFLSQDPVDDFSNAVCFEKDEHKKEYAFNLCQCTDCLPNGDEPEQVCTRSTGNMCAETSYGITEYDYSSHKVVVDCNAISTIDTYGQSGPGVAADYREHGAAGAVNQGDAPVEEE